MSINRFVIITPKQFGGIYQADSVDGIERVSLSFSNFAVASTTANFDLTNVPASALLEDVFGILRQNFTGGAVGSATISVGTTATPTAYVLATSVFAGAPATIGVTNAQKGASFTSPQTVFVNQATPWSTGTIRVQLITTVANANALTQGKIDLFFMMRGVSVRNI